MNRRKRIGLLGLVALAGLGLLACQMAEVFNSEAGLDTADVADATLTAFATEIGTAVPTPSDTAVPTENPSATDTSAPPPKPAPRVVRPATPRVEVNPTRSFGQFPGSPRGQGFNPQATPGERAFFGQVTAVNGGQITLDNRRRFAGSATLTVDLTSATQFRRGTASEIQPGTRIAGAGTANSDGSITAVTIEVNPSFGAAGQ